MRRTFLVLGLLACGGAAAASQSAPSGPPPYIGYAYPAGGQQGTTLEITVGGENIQGSTAAVVSGRGVAVEVADSRDPSSASATAKKKKKKPNQTVIDEVVKLKITIAPDAEPGLRDLCLLTPDGLSNKRAFQVDQIREVREDESSEKKSGATLLPALPVAVNGQIMPGDADTFRFSARKGQQLVVEASARALIPYIADAVPGWFQAVLSLHDDEGREVAYADDYRFNPDPVLFYDVPANGDYRLTVRDSIYRGRADFVYRLRIGELPFITSVFPLGASRGGGPVTVSLSGKNLPVDSIAVPLGPEAPFLQFLSVTRDGLVSNRVPFAVENLPDITEPGTASAPGPPRPVSLPVIVNGRIRTPGEKDSFSFAGRKDQAVSIEVRARRLGSPLDSFVVLLDSGGGKVAENDDFKDRSEGLLTHHADSGLQCRLPADGTYTVCVGDRQGNGGEEYAYRLRISEPLPAFELRATPSELVIPRGGSAPLTIHAMRQDGFRGEIRISIEEPSAPGLSLDGAAIPDETDKVRLTVTASDRAEAKTIFPRLRGTAIVDGKTLSSPVIPADELMQAFIYEHLVPARAQVVTVPDSPAPFSVSAELPEEGYVTLTRGRDATFKVRVARREGFNGSIRLQLMDPPKGITLQKASLPAGKDSALVTVRTASAAEAGAGGNLILSGMMTVKVEAPDEAAPGRTGPPPAAGAPEDKGGGAKKTVFQKWSVTLPAVPFRLADRAEAPKPESVKSRRN